MSEFVWEPSPERVEQANVVRLWRKLGCESYHELHRLSIEEPERFWPALIDDLGLEFSTPWERVLDESAGIEWATWFVGGRLNIATNCVHRHAERRPDDVAAVFLGEDGTRRERTYAELSRETTQLAEALVELGVEPGDRVAIYMPMCPEVAVASHACAHVGAVQVPIFSGFAAPAIAQRLEASDAKVVICADGSFRRGRRLPMRETVDEAGGDVAVIEWNRERAEWPELVRRQPGTLPALQVDSEHPYLLTYTSGTTGQPKGVLHVHGGFLVSIAREVAYQTDVNEGDVVHFATDMGWIMGPWTVVGRRRARRDDRLRRGRPRLARRQALANGRAGARDDVGRLAHADPRAAPEGRAADRHLFPSRDHDDGRAVEPRPLPLAPRARRPRADADREHQRRHRGRRVLSLGVRGVPDQADLARLPGARRGHGRLRSGRALGARRGRRARLQAAVPRDDARSLGRARALPRDVLAPLPRRLDARGLGVGRRGRVLVPARTLRRHAEHRGQAHRAGRARVGGRLAPRDRGGRRGRRAARGEGRGGLDLLRAFARHGRRGAGRRG